MKSVVLNKEFDYQLGEWKVTKINGLVKTIHDTIFTALIRLEKDDQIHDARFDLAKAAVIDHPFLNYENTEPHILYDLAHKIAKECLDD